MLTPRRISSLALAATVAGAVAAPVATADGPSVQLREHVNGTSPAHISGPSFRIMTAPADDPVATPSATTSGGDDEVLLYVAGGVCLLLVAGGTGVALRGRRRRHVRPSVAH